MGGSLADSLHESELFEESEVKLMDYTERARLHTIVKREFAKHRWDTFVDEPPSMARGGRGVVVPGCSICRVRLQTVSQFTDHLCEKVEAALDREFALYPARLPIALHRFSPFGPA